MNTTSRSFYYDDSSMQTWDRVKEALRRDWEQTKHDLGMKGGHELNQDVTDTVKQAMDKEPIPAADKPNPPKVIGSWDDAEYPISYGYAARGRHEKAHPSWSGDLEKRLEADWNALGSKVEHKWNHVKDLVRYGYEHDRTAS